jgi:hypothetical protein
MANTFFSPFGGTANPSGGSQPSTFNAGNIGAGVSDIFQGFADQTKAQGDVLGLKTT